MGHDLAMAAAAGAILAAVAAAQGGGQDRAAVSRLQQLDRRVGRAR